MSSSSSPAFGQADLSNCERELIHLAGSIQPHGVLLTVREPQMRLLQLSTNVSRLLGVSPDHLLNQPLAELGGDLDAQVRRLAAGPDLADPVPFRCELPVAGRTAAFEGALHRAPGDLLVIELEPVALREGDAPTVDLDTAALGEQLGRAMQRFSAAAAIGTLSDAVVKCLRELTGYDRVMVYKFDPDGHGEIIAEARDPRLETLLGHHYPATDIPQRARELYIRNRVRVLVDVNYDPVPLVPRQVPGLGAELDMSMSHLRSMSPLHLQYLRNMGVTATLVVSLVREGRLWGLIACHHYSPRNLRYAVRAAADMLAEVISTRIAAIENYAHIGDLPLAMQSKLLRAIQERSVRQVGATAELPVNVRIVSATHKDLAAEVQEGRFRQDLYYRLNVIQVRMPPLRERSADLALICSVALARIADDAGVQPAPKLAPDALDQLLRYAFPGNVRELENLLHRAVTLSGGDLITAADLALGDEAGGDSDWQGLESLVAAAPAPAAADVPPLPTDLVAHLDAVERDIIVRALAVHRYNRTAAGSSLGLSLRQMRYRMARLGIQVAEHGPE